MSNILDDTTSSSIDLNAAHNAMLQCAQHEADVLLAQAEAFVFKAQDIMAKAREPVHDIEKMIAKAQEPIFPSWRVARTSKPRCGVVPLWNPTHRSGVIRLRELM